MIAVTKQSSRSRQFTANNAGNQNFVLPPPDSWIATALRASRGRQGWFFLCVIARNAVTKQSSRSRQFTASNADSQNFVLPPPDSWIATALRASRGRQGWFFLCVIARNAVTKQSSRSRQFTASNADSQNFVLPPPDSWIATALRASRGRQGWFFLCVIARNAVTKQSSRSRQFTASNADSQNFVLPPPDSWIATALRAAR